MKPIELDSVHLKEAREEFFTSLRPGQLMESLFDSVPGVYYFVKDRKCRFMSGGDNFAQLFAVETMEQMIGKSDYDYSPDFLADSFHADDEKVMSTGVPIHNRIELVPTSDGSLDWLCTSKVPLYGQFDEVIGLAGVARIIRDSDKLYADHPEMHLIVDFVRARYRDKISVSDMAKEGGISVSSQERLFRKTFGLTPLMYLRKTRLNAACMLLRETDTGLSQIAVECGFNDQTNMTRAFRLELKITPLRYRRRFSDEVIKSPRKTAKKLFLNPS